MRVILDTNLFVSALVTSDTTLPSRLVRAWRNKRIVLISSEMQIEELRHATHYLKVRRRLLPSEVGRLINQLRADAALVTPTPGIDASPDPQDNYLLGMAQAGAVGYLVSGDKRHLLDLGRWHQTHIITARAMVDILKL